MPRRRRFAIALLLALAGSGLLVSLQSRALAGDGDLHEIAAAPALTWGFKASWRSYAFLPQTGDGAVAGGPGLYDVQWPFASGSYDAETRTTRVRYGGSVHWQKYRASELGWSKPPGYQGPEADPYLLDVTLSDPEITIGGDSSTLTAVASSRDKSSWEMVDYGRVPIVDLDVFDVTPTVSGGVTQWPGIVSTVSAAGSPVFDGTYRVGQVVDDVAFSYTGPGGAPDFSEHWDEPGAVALELLQNALFVDGEETIGLESPPWVDRKNLVVHSARPTTVDGVNSRRFDAFDLKTMAPVGAPWIVPNTQFPQTSRIVAYDTNRNRLLYRGGGETGITRWLRFDPEAPQYESGLIADPQLKSTAFIGAANRKLAWDPTRNRGYRVERVVPAGVGSTDYDNHVWQLITYREGSDGIWVKKSFDLPGFGPGQNQFGYVQESSFDVPRYATASDGSLILLPTGRTSTDPSNPAPATVPGAYRLTIDAADESVAVQSLPIEVANDGSGLFGAVQTSANGQILLLQLEGAGNAVHCEIGDGGQVTCDDPVSVRDVELPPYNEWRFAIDPADGMVWFAGVDSQKLAGIRNGELVGGQVLKERNPRGGPVLVGAGHTVYAQTNDGSPGEFNGSKTWGYGKLERLGFAPMVTSQPQPGSVSLGAGEASETVTFGSTATGDPAPARRWQVRAPGSPRFADLEGESGETLAVEATRAADGAEYRAVYENAAGRVATEPAALTVEYAPLVLADAADASVAEGDAAAFSVIPDGNPEPAVAWQRRVGGFWQTIDWGDDNFELDGAALTVIEANTEQSGALFRAKLTNSVGSAFSRAARLAVAPRVEIPPGGLDLDGVSLTWTGNEEMQKAPPFGGSSYFSAGASDGDEASYVSVEGNAAVYQVSAAGGEALATWGTRDAHVGSGGGQLARLYGGEARIEPDGAATVHWEGAFSVNFYGGMVPFTLADPELTVDAGGSGELSADLSGYASSQANPSQRSPLAPVADVTIATFSGVEVDPGGKIEVESDYAGVEADVPVPFAPQDRTGAGWGAWPQPFVEFHAQTGLAPYWYSSGGAFDPYKQPDPFVVDFEGGPAPAGPLAEEPSGGSPPVGAGPGPGARQPQSKATEPLIAARARALAVGPGRVARLATLTCPEGAFCAVLAPRRARVQIGGEALWARVLAPRVLDSGDSATLRLKLSKRALRKLGRHTGSVRVSVALHTEAGTARRVIAVRLRRG